MFFYWNVVLLKSSLNLFVVEVSRGLGRMRNRFSVRRVLIFGVTYHS